MNNQIENINRLQLFADNLREILHPVLFDPKVRTDKIVKKIGRSDFELSNLQIMSFAQNIPILLSAISDGKMSFIEYMKTGAVPNMVTNKPKDVHEILPLLKEPNRVLTDKEQKDFWLSISSMSNQIRLNVFKFEPTLFQAAKYYFGFFGQGAKDLLLTKMAPFANADLSKAQHGDEWEWLNQLGLNVKSFEKKNYDLTEDEWASLGKLHFNVFLALAGADGSVSKKEVENFKKSIKQNKFSVNPLIGYVLHESYRLAEPTDLNAINQNLKSLSELQKSVHDIEKLYAYKKNSSTYVQIHQSIKQAVNTIEAKFEFMEIFEIKKSCLDIAFNTAGLGGITVGEKFSFDIVIALLNFTDFGSKKEGVGIQIFPLLSGRNRINTYGKGVGSKIMNTELVNTWVNKMNYKDFIHFLTISYTIESAVSAIPDEIDEQFLKYNGEVCELSDNEYLKFKELLESIREITAPLCKSYEIDNSEQHAWSLFLATPYLYAMTRNELLSVEFEKQPFSGFQSSIQNKQITFTDEPSSIKMVLENIFKNRKKDTIAKEVSEQLMQLYIEKGLLNMYFKNQLLQALHNPEKKQNILGIFTNNHRWYKDYPEFDASKYASIPYSILTLLASGDGKVSKNEIKYIDQLQEKITKQDGIFGHKKAFQEAHPLLNKCIESGASDIQDLKQHKFAIGAFIKIMQEVQEKFLALENTLSPLDLFSVKVQLLQSGFVLADMEFGGFSDELGLLPILMDVFGFDPSKEYIGSFIGNGFKKGTAKNAEQITFESYIQLTVNRHYSYSIIKTL